LPYISPIFFKEFFKKKKVFKTYIRNTNVSSKFINKKIKIYNGLEFEDIIIRSDLIGFKLGSFSFTKKII
jgi:small subunit ribosomal protein S19